MDNREWLTVRGRSRDVLYNMVISYTRIVRVPGGKGYGSFHYEKFSDSDKIHNLIVWGLVKRGYIKSVGFSTVTGYEFYGIATPQLEKFVHARYREITGDNQT